MSELESSIEREVGVYALRAVGAAALVFAVVLFVGLGLWHPERGAASAVRHLGFVFAFAAVASAGVLVVAASPLAMQRRPGRER